MSHSATSPPSPFVLTATWIASQRWGWLCCNGDDLSHPTAFGVRA
jgi:hypothetical protein